VEATAPSIGPKSDGGGEPAVTFDRVRFSWRGRIPFQIEIDAFVLNRGERVLLLGPSGSGKSTLLSLLAGISTPDAGRITVLGQDLAGLRAAARDRFRADHFGIIFQMFNLLPYGSLIDNVTLPLNFSRIRRARVEAGSGIEKTAVLLLETLGIDGEMIRGGDTRELSVGQQQRVAAARALIGSPEIIVADEPTSALDRDAQGKFLHLLFSAARASSASIVMVSHDHTLAPLFDRVVNLTDISHITRGSGT
jgi:putative ABC transport system ATP-binding protein